MLTQKDQTFQLGLISMPWSIFNRPSIQLASLKAYLDHETQIETTLFHPYLAAAAALGGNTYHHLAKNSWAGEALYSPLLFPEQQGLAEKLFVKSCAKDTVLAGLDYNNTWQLLEENLDQWLATIDFSSYDLIGFSICFNQLLSSLTAAKRIKAQHPNLPIVIGGSGCVGTIGRSLLNSFSQIDYVISGEGEEALQQLCHFLQSNAKTVHLAPHIFGRNTKGQIESSCSGIADLNSLPIPDYAPYFQEMCSNFTTEPFVPVLPIEFSRGCWWNKCTFCNLNFQWHGYRWKSAESMFTEVQQQSTRHQCLDFCFTDNALPPKEADAFFKSTAQTSAGYDFFAEVRILTDPDTPLRYQRGGLSTIQVGIESLSTSLLKKMKKGTTAIENIAAMRQSAEAGIQLEGNIIIEFPGSTKEEVQETLKNLDFVLPYSPLSSASFFLGHGSPVAAKPREYGIQAMTRHPNNKKLIPKKILNNLDMLIKDYRGDRTFQRKQWKDVSKKIKIWNTFHNNRKSSRPPLSYRDGNSFLLIRQEQLTGPPLQHRLQGRSREIYLFCRKIRNLKEIHKKFSGIPITTVQRFLMDLRNKKLIFHENNLFLTLAINQDSFQPFPST
jgi:ribosomal peptide maturation radical SAM protein 1